MSRFICWLILLDLAHSSAQDCPANPWSESRCDVDCCGGASYTINSCQSDALEANTKSYPRNETFKYVDFVNSSMTTIRNFAFDGLPIIYLVFAHSFTTVEAQAFSGIKDIKGLYFVNNPQLTSLPKGLFRNLTSLQMIGLMYNGLTRIHGDTFSGLHNLNTLELFGNKLTCLPHNLLHQMTVWNTVIVANPVLFYPTTQELIYKYGVNVTRSVDYKGLCAKSFSNTKAHIEYHFKVDRCVKECSAGGRGLKVIPSDKECDCSSMEGCLDDNCDAVIATTTPGYLAIEEDDEISKPTRAPCGASQTILPGNLCLTVGLSLRVISLVLLY